MQTSACLFQKRLSLVTHDTFYYIFLMAQMSARLYEDNKINFLTSAISQIKHSDTVVRNDESKNIYS